MTELRRAVHEWKFWARPDQFSPEGQWTTWLVMGGRGAGKTRTGAEWIADRVRHGVRRVALVGETYEDVREVMIEGPSGLAVTGDPSRRPTYEPSRHRLKWPCGAAAHVFSSEDPEGLRGHQFEVAWCDEVAKWAYGEESWTNLQLGLRLGEQPRQVVTTTPRPVPLLRQLLSDDRTVVSTATTYDNRVALADAFLTEVAATYEGTRLGRQELLGELIEDVSGALWSRSLIEACRVGAVPPLDRIVVAVDPPVSSGPSADECGIVVAGAATVSGRTFAYVLHDGTVSGCSPAAWADEIAVLCERFQADRVVAEVNQGGDLVEEVLRVASPELPFKAVRATRGKVLRAEPIAALYEQKRVFHAGRFSALEDQMATYAGPRHQGSPDRLDALVWAITELLLLKPGADPTVHFL